MKKKCSVITALLLTLFIFAGIFNVNTVTSEAATPALTSTYKMMYAGQTYKNTVKNASASSVKWSSSNSSIAYVSEGTITAVKGGIATIYATVNGKKLSMKVEVVSKTAYTAVNYALKAVGCKYSQSKRMKTGYYDCGSLVWRSYAAAGYYLGSSKKNAPTAADGARTAAAKGKIIAYKGVSASNLLPGDLIYTSSYRNGRYRNITHAEIYIGNGKIVHAANSRTGVCKANYSTKGVVLIVRPTTASAASTITQSTKLVSACAVSSSASCTSVKVTWKTFSDATGYRVYRKVPGGSWGRIATFAGASISSYIDTNATPGTYTYTVRAYYGSTENLGGFDNTGVTASTKIGQPENVSASVDSEEISITCSSVNYAIAYQFYKRVNGDTWYQIATTTEPSYTDEAVESGNTYEYAVRAYCTCGTSTIYGSFTFGNAVEYEEIVSKNINAEAVALDEAVVLDDAEDETTEKNVDAAPETVAETEAAAETETTATETTEAAVAETEAAQSETTVAESSAQ